jgi:hypothetical protein
MIVPQVYYSGIFLNASSEERRCHKCEMLIRIDDTAFRLVVPNEPTRYTCLSCL